MTGDGEGNFTTVLASVRAPLRYRVTAAGSASPWFDVSVVPPPRAGSFEGRFTYPAYTGIPERHRKFNGNLEVLPGTEVALSFAATSDLSEGQFHLGDTVSEGSPIANNGSAEGRANNRRVEIVVDHVKTSSR